MKVIATINQKGGACKTTTALALVSGLKAKGYKVLAVDLDPQCNFSYSLGLEREGLTIFEVLKGTPIKEAIREVNGLSIVPSSNALATADLEFTKLGKEHKLKKALESVSSEFDYCIIDNPPQLSILTINSLTASDGVIIPTQADVYNLRGIADLKETIEAVKEYTNPQLKVLGLLVTRYNGRRTFTKAIASVLEQVATALDTKVYKTSIREGIAIQEAEYNRVDLLTYDDKSKAIQDYKDFINEFLEAK